MAGNGSGCDVTWIYISKPVNGTVALKDAEGNEIKSGDKVKRNSPITLIATPADGYMLDKVLVNGNAIEGTEFKISRISTVEATFKLATGIEAVSETGANVSVSNGTIIATLPEGTAADVYTASGEKICSVSAGTSLIPVASGTYILRVKDGTASARTMKVNVK